MYDLNIELTKEQEERLKSADIKQGFFGCRIRWEFYPPKEGKK